MEIASERPDTSTINMGPSHPATHGVLRDRPRARRRDGRRAAGRTSATSIAGMEKIAENRTVPAVHPLHRPDGLPEPAGGERRFRPRGREALGHRGSAALPGRSASSAASWRGSARTSSGSGRPRSTSARRRCSSTPSSDREWHYDLVEDSDRRASDDVLHARGRGGVRRHAGVAEAAFASSSMLPRGSTTTRSLLTNELDLAQAHAGVGR